jgi:hypothetical protein
MLGLVQYADGSGDDDGDGDGDGDGDLCTWFIVDVRGQMLNTNNNTNMLPYTQYWTVTFITPTDGDEKDDETTNEDCKFYGYLTSGLPIVFGCSFTYFLQVYNPTQHRTVLPST